jgi:putative hydrolase of HD superfamily
MEKIFSSLPNQSHKYFMNLWHSY